jgi:hypothetical protein
MADEQFDKDFGYLMPFLDKIAAAASSVADPAAREEFVRLVAGEKSKWARIRQLLSGAPSQPATRPGGAVREPNTQSPNETKEAFAFTVGSLRPRK